MMTYLRFARGFCLVFNTEVGDTLLVLVIKNESPATGVLLVKSQTSPDIEASLLVVGKEDLLDDRLVGILNRLDGYCYTYDVVMSDVIGLSPSTHDVGVIEGDESDDINTVTADFVEMSYGTGKMIAGACWGESTYSKCAK